MKLVKFNCRFEETVQSRQFLDLKKETVHGSEAV